MGGSSVNNQDITQLLLEAADRFESPDFIEKDPIRLPHTFQRREDIEIVAFLVSTIAWGKRELIIRSGERLLELMEGSPYEFLMGTDHEYWQGLPEFKHRTFNHQDLMYFFDRMKHQYTVHGSLQHAFSLSKDPWERLRLFRAEFIANLPPGRTSKHLADVSRNAAAKRINMFLRWMVRPSAGGVDFGIWNDIPLNSLLIPLDVHTSNTARALDFVTRKQNDRRTCEEVTRQCRLILPEDPCKLDYALFGLSLEGKAP